MGPLLTHFIWDSHGILWDGGKKSWTPDLPTDAQIIMHLFTVYMDLAMPSHPSMTLDRFPFSYKYYVPMEAKPDPSTALQIKQTLKTPPNYNLVVDGSMWEVVPVSDKSFFLVVSSQAAARFHIDTNARVHSSLCLLETTQCVVHSGVVYLSGDEGERGLHWPAQHWHSNDGTRRCCRGIRPVERIRKSRGVAHSNKPCLDRDIE